MSFTSTGTPAVFLDAILDITSLCIQEEMIRTDTRRIVAFMTNLHPLWNWPKM